MTDTTDILETVLDQIVDIVFDLARWVGAETGFLEGHPKYLLTLVGFLIFLIWWL